MSQDLGAKPTESAVRADAYLIIALDVVARYLTLLPRPAPNEGGDPASSETSLRIAVPP